MRRSAIGFAALLVASCGAIQSSQVADQIKGMVGLSNEVHVKRGATRSTTSAA